MRASFVFAGSPSALLAVLVVAASTSCGPQCREIDACGPGRTCNADGECVETSQRRRFVPPPRDVADAIDPDDAYAVADGACYDVDDLDAPMFDVPADACAFAIDRFGRFYVSAPCDADGAFLLDDVVVGHPCTDGPPRRVWFAPDDDRVAYACADGSVVRGGGDPFVACDGGAPLALGFDGGVACTGGVAARADPAGGFRVDDRAGVFERDGAFVYVDDDGALRRDDDLLRLAPPPLVLVTGP